MKVTCRQFITPTLFFALVFGLFALNVGAAATPAQYRARIREAKNSIDILLYSDDEETNRAENSAFEREALKNIRRKLPPTETVELQHASVETRNNWLSEKLDAFEKETDTGKRRAILNEISERLGALDAELGELEKSVADARAKDEDKQKLAEILRRDEYRKPEPQQESFLHKTWREFLEWLDKHLPKISPFSMPEGGLATLSFVLQLVIYALVVGIIGFLIYRFAPFLRERFRRREKKSRAARVVLGETLAADADAQNLFAEAEDLARAGDLRAAIRKGYIALLCELSDRKIIGLARHKTNRDYLRDVRASGELYRNMSGLTTSFERHWYGFTSTDRQDWEAFERQYKETINS